MAIKNLEPGAVLETDWNYKPIRIIGFDDIEVFYDCWWPHLNGWGFAQQRRKLSYYRVAKDVLCKRATRLRVEPLTRAELDFLRPDLPFRLCRFPNLNWTSSRYPMIEAYAADAKKVSPRFRVNGKRVVLPISAVVLEPFGPKGSTKRGSVVEAKAFKGFSALELLWHAHNLEAAYVKDWKNGVGIYRSGVEHGIPSYYLWGVVDKAGIADPVSGG